MQIWISKLYSVTVFWWCKCLKFRAQYLIFHLQNSSYQPFLHDRGGQIFRGGAQIFNSLYNIQQNMSKILQWMLEFYTKISSFSKLSLDPDCFLLLGSGSVKSFYSFFRSLWIPKKRKEKKKNIFFCLKHSWMPAIVVIETRSIIILIFYYFLLQIYFKQQQINNTVKRYESGSGSRLFYEIRILA